MIWSGHPTRCWLALLLAGFSLVDWSPLLAQEDFWTVADDMPRVLLPDPEAQRIRPLSFFPLPDPIEAGRWQLVEVKLEINSEPLGMYWGMARAGQASVAPLFFQTDALGIGRFMVRSDREGADTLVASVGSATAYQSVDFLYPDGDLLPDIGSYELQAAIPDRVDLKIEDDLIGLLTIEGVSRATVEHWAEGLSLEYSAYRGGGLHVLRSQPGLSQDTRQRLAAKLKEHRESVVRGAGLMARGTGLNHAIMLDDRSYVRFKPGAGDPDSLRTLLESDYGLVVDEQTPYAPLEFVVRPSPETPQNPLSVARRLLERSDVLYAHVEFAQRLYDRDEDTQDECDYSIDNWPPWCDARYNVQWHLENSGTDGATPDADIDVRSAWEFGTGSKDTLIAVIDSSFYLDHPDLEPNLYGAIKGGDRFPQLSSQDRGIDLADNDPSSLLPTYEVTESSLAHGTNSAGVAVAASGKTDENPGGDVTGICPNCQLLPIRVRKFNMNSEIRDAFYLASVNQADVISMSMSFNIVTDDIEEDLLRMNQLDESSASAVVVFAMSNEPEDNCEDEPDSASIESVISVGGINDLERRNTGNTSAQGYGNCMDLLAPTRGGLRGIATTHVVRPPSGVVQPHQFNGFGGTSAATPQVAGVAALILDATRPESTLSPIQVQMILQDTADKVEPDKAGYQPETGFSRPNGEDPSTHAYGRLNAHEAVRLAATQGKNNRDLFIRDKALDWGNTSRQIDPGDYADYMQSPDIKIDYEPLQFPGITDPQPKDFAGLESEEPQSGSKGQVWVRVRNRGQFNVSHADLSLHYGLYRETLPALPANIGAVFTMQPGDTQGWSTIGTKKLENIPYSGASLAGCPARDIPQCRSNSSNPEDLANIVVFDLPEAVSWNEQELKFALMAVISSDQDPVRATPEAGADASPELLMEKVVYDNNVALLTEREQQENENNGNDHRNCLCLSAGALAVLLLLLLI